MSGKNIISAEYTQIPPERDVTFDNFSKGQIRFKMDLDSSARWNPKMSFFRIRVRLKEQGTNARLSEYDLIAPNMFMGDCLWQQMCAKCNGVKVSSIDDYVEQVSALRQRITKSEERRSKFLQDLNFADGSFYKRQAQMTRFGYQADDFELASIRGTSVTLDNNTIQFEELGFDPQNTITILANGTVTMAANGQPGFPPVLSEVLRIGDIFTYFSGGSGHSGTIVEINNLASQFVMRGNGNFPIVVGSQINSGVNLFRIAPAGMVSVTGVGTLFTEDVKTGETLVVVSPNHPLFDGVEQGITEAKILRVVDDTTLHIEAPAIGFEDQVDFYVRRRKPARRLRDIELIWRPKMGLWSLNQFLPGNWEIVLTPHSLEKFRKYAIESLDISVTPGVDYDLDVISMNMYVYKGRVNKPSSGSKRYDFTEIRMQGQVMTTNTLLNHQFVVNRNNHTLTLAYQSADAGDDTRHSRTKFKVAVGNTEDYELQLHRYHIRHNGITLPTPLPDITKSADGFVDFTAQQYFETQIYNGTIMLDAPETLYEWQSERGPYYSYQFPPGMNKKSAQVFISSEFNAPFPGNFLVCLFDHYYRSFTLHTQNGYVTKCEANTKVN